MITLAVIGATPDALTPLCRELTKLVGDEVTSTHPATYAELASAFEKDRVQYAWMSPSLLVLTDENTRITPLLSAVRNDQIEYRAGIFVSADSRFHSLEQLRDTTVAWVATTSASGYLFPRVHLATRGLEPTTFFGHELFVNSHAEVVRAVADGRADCGATYVTAIGSGFFDVAPDHPMRILEHTRAIPNDVIAGHGLIPKTEQRVFSNAILTLAERDDGRALLRTAFQADRFTITPRNALRPLWEHVRLARKHGLLPHL